MKRLLTNLDDQVSVAEEIYQFATNRWPIPEALGYIQHKPKIPSALAIIGFAAPFHSGPWPKRLNDLDKKCSYLFAFLAMLLEVDDDLYPLAVQFCNANSMEGDIILDKPRRDRHIEGIERGSPNVRPVCPLHAR